MKNKFLMASTCLSVALACSSVSAADLPRRATPAPVVATAAYAPAYMTWTGFYVGINGGFIYFEPTKTARSQFGKDNSGGMIGGTIGYNYQINDFVVGVEGDLGWTSISKKYAYSYTYPANSAGGVITAQYANKLELNGIGTVRVRVGYAIDRAMIFVTGGYAGAQLRGKSAYIYNAVYSASPNSNVTNAMGTALNQSKYFNGWTVGGGLEYSFTNEFSIKVDYLYVRLSNQTLLPADPITGASIVKTGGNVSMVKAGLNYRF